MCGACMPLCVCVCICEFLSIIFKSTYLFLSYSSFIPKIGFVTMWSNFRLNSGLNYIVVTNTRHALLGERWVYCEE